MANNVVKIVAACAALAAFTTFSSANITPAAAASAPHIQRTLTQGVFDNDDHRWRNHDDNNRWDNDHRGHHGDNGFDWGRERRRREEARRREEERRRAWQARHRWEHRHNDRDRDHRDHDNGPYLR